MIKENNHMGIVKKTSTKKKVSKISKNKNLEIIKFNDLEGKFLLVKVGNPENPADTEQIQNIKKQIIELFEKNNINCLTLVTHHAVSIEIIEKEKDINGI